MTLNREAIYEFEGSVNVVAQAPWDQLHLNLPKAAGWKVRGTVKFHRNAEKTLAASVIINIFFFSTFSKKKKAKSFHCSISEFRQSDVNGVWNK